MGGERAGELTLLVAEHYERAGEPALAAERLRVAGEAALRVGAYEEALATLQRARDLVSAPEHLRVRAEVTLNMGEVLAQTGHMQEGHDLLEAMLPDLRASGDLKNLGRTLGHLGRIGMWQDDPGPTKAHLSEALEVARKIGDEQGLMFLLRQLGNISLNEFEKAEAYFEESLALARRLGDRIGEASALNGFGNLMQLAGKIAQSNDYYLRGQAAAKEVKNSFLSTITYINLAENLIWEGDTAKGLAMIESTIQSIREMGDKGTLPGAIMDLAWGEIRAGQLVQGRKHLLECLEGHREQGAMFPLVPLAMFALLEAKKGNRETALEWMGLVRAQPTLHPAAADFFVRPDWEEMTAGFSPAEVDAALARGARLSLDEVFKQIESQSEEVGAAGA